MNWRPSASHAALKLRARMLATARAFFERRGALEVETPILSVAGVSDPQIECLSTQITGLEARRYLCPSPEYAMKRLLAAGSGDIYQICKVFRDEEIGRWHSPEFTMIEWYRVGWDDTALMDEVEALLGQLLEPVRRPGMAERLSFSAALQRHAGVDPFESSEAALLDAARRHGVHCDAELDRDAKLDLLMGLVVGPRLGRGHPCFVCDYPASQAALARLKPGLPRVAARFELYLDGLELANGFHELAQPKEQRERFMRDLALRGARGRPQPPLDENLLAALEHGLPDCAGVALGFDRVVAIALAADGLADTVSFSVDRA